MGSLKLDKCFEIDSRLIQSYSYTSLAIAAMPIARYALFDSGQSPFFTGLRSTYTSSLDIDLIYSSRILRTKNGVYLSI